MRLFSGKIAALSAEVVRALRSGGDIEVESAKDVELDVAAVLNQYLADEHEITERAKDMMQARGLPQSEFNRLKRLFADQKGIKIGEDTLDYLLDQVVQMLLHSVNVEEVFAED